MWRRKQGWEWCLWNKKTRIANSHQKLEVDPLEPLEPCQHFNFGLLTFRRVRKFISFVLSHLVGSNLLQQPSVQSLSCVQLFAIQWTAAHQASLSITNSQNLLKPMSIESVMPSNHLTLCRPLLLLPSVFPSIRVFSNEAVLRIRWPKYWSFSFNISPSNEYSGLISFSMDWLDLLAVQGTLKSLLQHHRPTVDWRMA